MATNKTTKYYLVLQQYSNKKWNEIERFEILSTGNFPNKKAKENFRLKQKEIRANGLPTKISGSRITV